MGLIKGKKAAVGYVYANWPELLTFIFLIVGFILAATAKSAVVSYIIIFFCGAIGGRLWYQKRDDLKVPIVLILMGFFVGFAIGNFYGSLIVTTLAYLFGIVVSYNLHARKTLQ